MDLIDSIYTLFYLGSMPSFKNMLADVPRHELWAYPPVSQTGIRHLEEKKNAKSMASWRASTKTNNFGHSIFLNRNFFCWKSLVSNDFSQTCWRLTSEGMEHVEVWTHHLRQYETAGRPLQKKSQSKSNGSLLSCTFIVLELEQKNWMSQLCVVLWDLRREQHQWPIWRPKPSKISPKSEISRNHPSSIRYEIAFLPIQSVYGIFTNINPQNGPNVGKYTIHHHT